MNKWLTRTVAIAAVTGISATAVAGGRYEADRYYDTARVMRVDPITEVVRLDDPHQVCWTEQVTYQERTGRRGTATPEILGGIIGGVVGNQFGHGQGRSIATVAGALLGGSIAHDVKRQRAYGYTTYTEPVERCRIEHAYYDEERIVGYDVKYRYNGKVYRTRMDRDPGNTVRVRVGVGVAE